MTGHVTKPGVDWVAIEAGYRSGTSCRKLSRDYPGISHVAIAKRAKRFQWKVDDAVTLSTALTKLTSESLPNAHKATDTRRAIILEKLGNGSTLDIAAKACGITPETLRSWRKSDATFALAVETAQANWAERQVVGIEAAGKAGDWRARSWLLERSPSTRDEYGQQVRPAGPQISVTLNMPYPKIEGQITDVESTPAGPTE